MKMYVILRSKIIDGEATYDVLPFYDLDAAKKYIDIIQESYRKSDWFDYCTKANDISDTSSKNTLGVDYTLIMTIGNDSTKISYHMVLLNSKVAEDKSVIDDIIDKNHYATTAKIIQRVNDIGSKMLDRIVMEFDRKDIYSCKCGTIRGRINDGLKCPQCNTICKSLGGENETGKN